jgi:glutathione S-transferase
MVVYGSSLAPPARKVLAFIGEKGFAAEHRPVAPHDASPAFKLASPLGQIPAFSDDTVNLSDSSAICHYLERRYPYPALFPAEAESYGRMVWFDQFADHFLGAAECKIVVNLVVKPMRGEGRICRRSAPRCTTNFRRCSTILNRRSTARSWRARP